MWRTRFRLGRSIGKQAARVFPIYLPPTREHMGRYSHDLAWAAQSESRPECSPPGNKQAIILLAGTPPKARTGGALPELSSVEESTGGGRGASVHRGENVLTIRAQRFPFCRGSPVWFPTQDKARLDGATEA